jgi:D-glutamate cyclase
MMDARLEQIRHLIQEDVGNRGLRTDPEDNLINVCAHDFERACRSVAETQKPALAVVTGFYIPHASPPCGETDGPLGALFLARALTPLGIRVMLLTDDFCVPALQAGLEACRLTGLVPLVALDASPGWMEAFTEGLLEFGYRGNSQPTHLIALERVGPSHTPASLRRQASTTEKILKQYTDEVPVAQQGRCRTMRGLDITDNMSPAELLFETGKELVPSLTTIGIGDGGNEIGMGKIPWDIIRRNIPRGGLVACRVPTDLLIVCGVSNWGAYGLAAGIRLLRGARPDPDLFDPERERALLRVMVERGPLVDGTSGRPTITVDGLSFERYIKPLIKMGQL